jgi:F0F1-type ATP synthase membrane subunit c/vacuolar-type H+-ATPase subunit K
LQRYKKKRTFGQFLFFTAISKTSRIFAFSVPMYVGTGGRPRQQVK